MEMEEMTSTRRGGGGGGGGELIHYQQQDEDEEEGSEELHSKTIESNRLRAWHSSRIFRVSRASGGKDRHSKVLTAKGLRDRRVRLSVSTAIQFYDLQDRLGVDQPSKAVEWLIKKAADDISKLPSLESKFPNNPNNYLSDDDKRIVGSGRGGFEVELDNESIFQKQPLAISMSKSACSSTSETSKGSRSENRVKARERARERAAKDKDKDHLVDESHHNSQNSSFTELLTSGAGNHSPNQSTPAGFFLKQPRHHSPSPPSSMDYFSPGLFGPSAPAPARNQNQYSSAFSPHFGVTMPPPFNDQTRQNHHHPELQQFSFLSDHLIPGEQPGNVTGNEYNLNFSMSSSLAGYNRGTLQSNNSSPSPLPPPHLQRFAFPADGSNMLFCVGNPTNNATAPENHQFPLQLYYGGQHSETKGKDKR